MINKLLIVFLYFLYSFNSLSLEQKENKKSYLCNNIENIVRKLQEENIASEDFYHFISFINEEKKFDVPLSCAYIDFLLKSNVKSSDWLNFAKLVKIIDRGNKFNKIQRLELIKILMDINITIDEITILAEYICITIEYDFHKIKEFIVNFIKKTMNINDLQKLSKYKKSFDWHVEAIENNAIYNVLVNTSKLQKQFFPTKEEKVCLNRLNQIELKDLMSCFPKRSTGIRKLLETEFENNLESIKVVQQELYRAKFYERCYQHVLYIRELKWGHIKFTDYFSSFDDNNTQSNVLDIIEDATRAILKKAKKYDNENPGKLLAKYHILLMQNFYAKMKQQDPNKKIPLIDQDATFNLETEKDLLPQFLSIENLNKLLERLKYLRYSIRYDLLEK